MSDRDTKKIYSRGQTAFYLDMKLPLQSYYPQLEFMFGSAYDNTSSELQTYLCSVRIVHVGANIPCMDTNPTVSFEETTEKGFPDLAAVNISGVSNTGFTENRRKSLNSGIQRYVTNRMV